MRAEIPTVLGITQAQVGEGEKECTGAELLRIQAGPYQSESAYMLPADVSNRQFVFAIPETIRKIRNRRRARQYLLPNGNDTVEVPDQPG
jgi:hypothetical protein